MKKTMYQFREHKLEKELEQAHQKNKKEFTEKGGIDGSRNIPPTRGDNLAFCINPIWSKYQGLITKIDKQLQVAANADGSVDQMMLDKALAPILKEKEKLGKRIQAVAIDIDRLANTYSKEKLVIVIAAAIGIWVGDVAFNTQGFQSLGDSLLLTFMFAIAIGITLLVLAHGIPKIILKGRTLIQRFIYGGVCIAIVLLFLYFLALYRASYMHEMGMGGELASPFAFMVINLALLAATTILYHFYFPTKHEWQEINRKSKLVDELSELKKEKKKLEKKEENIQRQAGGENKLYRHMSAYARDLKRQVVCWYKETVSAYMQENALKRDDGVPNCFSQEPPELEIN